MSACDIYAVICVKNICVTQLNCFNASAWKAGICLSVLILLYAKICSVKGQVARRKGNFF